MSQRQQPKHKIDRRLGVNLWGSPKSPIIKRETSPGQHGARRKRPSNFGLQLMAKQKLKKYYGNINERRFRRYYQEADRRRGDTTENLIGLLERRLDAVVYRARFVPTVFAARQFVNHGHVLVNGQRVNIPSYALTEEDVITVKPTSREIPSVLEATANTERDVPDYVSVDHQKMVATFSRIPKLEEVPYPVQMEPNLVIEYYSR